MPNKSTIGIPLKCIKLASDYISEPLSLVFNQSLLHGTVPDILKISKVIPINKGGNPSNPADYHPISILSAFTQSFKKLIYKQLIHYIEKQKIPMAPQFGFRKGRLNAQAITEITEILRKAIDNNMYTCGVFIDFAKAFDTVNRLAPLQKLQKYSIRGLPLEWFNSYLSNRKQYVSD